MNRPVAWPPVAAPRLRNGEARTTAMDVVAFAIGVFIILLYAQAWVMPIAGDKPGAADSGTIRAAFFAGYAIALVLVIIRPGDFARALLRQPFLILLLWLMCMTSVWSITPDQTLRRAIGLTFTSLSAVAMASRFKWNKLAEVFATGFAIMAVLCFIAGAVMPGLGRMHELFPGAWRGLWSDKNLLGGYMALGGVIFAGAALLNPKRAFIWGPMVVLALLLIALSTSKTALLSCMFGLCGVAFVWLVRRGAAMSVATTYGALLGVVGLAMIVLFASDAVFAILGKDATLTGRTKIWAGVIHEIRQHPWIGWGYGAPWTDESTWGPLAWITKIAGFRAYHSHNSWLEQWLSAGVFGLGLWAAYFMETCVRAILAVYRSPGAYLALPFLLVYGVTSLTESIAVTFNNIDWILFVSIAAKLAFPDAAQMGGKAPMRRQPSATVTTSNPAFTTDPASRSSAWGEQPHGDGSDRTSWL
jgi:O-antigen ligase